MENEVYSKTIEDETPDETRKKTPRAVEMEKRILQLEQELEELKRKQASSRTSPRQNVSSGKRTTTTTKKKKQSQFSVGFWIAFAFFIAQLIFAWYVLTHY